MSMGGELPPDPLPEVKPHRLAAFVKSPIGILVTCLDCDMEVVGTACCEAEAVGMLVEHAERMGTT